MMTKAKTAARAKTAATSPTVANGKTQTLVLAAGPDDDAATVLAQAILGQNIRHGHVAAAYAGRMIGETGETLGLMDCAKVVQQRATDAIAGDLAFASAILASQAITLDSMFTEFARRAALNMNQFPEATERYARLAMKAQSNARATLETLAKLHQPREQTVRHVHVNQGGQAVVANQFHHYAGGNQNAESVKQSHATATAGDCAALSGSDAVGG